MWRILVTSVMLTGFNAFGAIVYLHFTGVQTPTPPWETSSVLNVMPHNKHVGVAILGTSHARSLSGCEASADAIEHSLDTTVLNLAKNAAGPMPLRLYAEEFVARGNSTDTLIYLADPWAFYSAKWNEEHGFLCDEPLAPRFFARCILAGRSPRQLFRNARLGFTNPTFDQYLIESNDCFTHLNNFSNDFAQSRINHLFNTQPSEAALQKYTAELGEIMSLAKSNGADVIIATPPTLLGEFPGMEAFDEAMQAVAAQHQARYYNFAEIMQDPAFYIDHDHLNAHGVAYFAENHLRPALDHARQQAG
jgi:hypothetical protein